MYMMDVNTGEYRKREISINESAVRFFSIGWVEENRNCATFVFHSYIIVND